MANSSATSRLPRGSVRATFDLPVVEPPGTRLGSPGDSAVAELVVRRQDISFTDIAPGRVGIAIRVTNVGSSRSLPTRAVVQAAALGAFVPWRPLTVLRVSALEPGDSVVLQTEAKRTFPRPLDPPDRLSPSQVLTALDFSEEPASAPATTSPLAPQPPLPVSPFDVLTGPSTYWAGNLNVFVGGQAVERHVARDLRILPGRTNAAMFIVGGRDDYRFDLVGLESDWNAQLYNPMRALALARGVSEGTLIRPGTWTPLRDHAMVLLVLRPPMECREAAIEVHVTQRSTQKTAVVEFSFNPRASGPGCYAVE